MVRTQIQFEERQYEQIRRIAHRKRISISEAVRRLVASGFEADPEVAATPRAVGLLEVAGIGQSGLEDLGRRHDDYLAEDLGR